MGKELYDQLNTSIRAVLEKETRFTDERKSRLDQFISVLPKHNDPIDLRFVCTHNSRRSIFSEVWAAVFAAYFQLEWVTTSSAGTESTAVYPSVIKALERSGMRSEITKNGYLIFLGEGNSKKLWSKTLLECDQSKSFVAIMTCNDADKNCPFVPGADHRVSLPYTDPKYSDGQSDENDVYFATSMEIAEELGYVFKSYLKYINER